jgi:hypothetical protein
MGEILLTELFDPQSSMLRDNYHDVIRDAINQQLEDTPWLRRADNARDILNNAGFGMYHARDCTSIISLRKPVLQRLILQCIKERPREPSTVHVHVLISFLLSEVEIPKPPRMSITTGSSARESTSRCQGNPV